MLRGRHCLRGGKRDLEGSRKDGEETAVEEVVERGSRTPLVRKTRKKKSEKSSKRRWTKEFEPDSEDATGLQMSKLE